MLPAGVVLRRATVRDAEAGAALHIACWREAYGPIVEPALLEAQLAEPERWAVRWRERIALGAPRLLALDGDDVVGFASVGTGRDEDTDVSTELYAIYVRQSWHGTGLGQVLLDTVLGGRSAYLWVLEANQRARAFYARNGFTPDGARKKFDLLDAWEERLVR
jgi:GNAT superfamily N-acetyltransferase